MPNVPIELFATCPQSTDYGPSEYRQRVADVARWSERQGCTGILVYSDNRLADAWLLSQIIIENTEQLCPLVAVQPVYMHPYTVANMVTSFAHLYRRRIYLNMVAGGFRNDLLALNDHTPHDERYARLTEYTSIIQRLLRGEAVTHEGTYCTVRGLKLSPPLPAICFPGIFMSGSSPAGREAARVLGATAICYPKPTDEDEGPGADVGVGGAGVRVGIIARPSSSAAWQIARARFPEDRKGRLTHQLAKRVTDSHWYQDLSELDDEPLSDENPYWLVPFKHYKSMCPYLVGSYERVAEELARYVTMGYHRFILDIPPDEEELEHTGAAFRRVGELVPA